MPHECRTCEYEKECFRFLNILNRLFRICRQGRLRKGARQVTRDQARLPVESEKKTE